MTMTYFVKKGLELALAASLAFSFVGCNKKDEYKEINSNLANMAVPAGELNLNMPAAKNQNNPFHMKYRLNSDGKYESFIDYTVIKVKNIPIKVQSKDSLGNYRYPKLADKALRPIEDVINDKFPISAKDIDYEYGSDSLIYSTAKFFLGSAHIKVHVENINGKPYVHSDTTFKENKF